MATKTVRAPMSRSRRAKQFQPFDALRGLKEAIAAKEKVMQTYNVVDLFAGAGGLSLGFLQTGRVHIVAAAENNPNARRNLISHWINISVNYQ